MMNWNDLNMVISQSDASIHDQAHNPEDKSIIESKIFKAVEDFKTRPTCRL